MKLKVMLLSVILTAFVSGCALNKHQSGESKSAQGDDKIFSLPYTMKTLDNGLRVIIVPTDYPDLVSLHVPVQTGSRNELEPGKTGFAHFFEHMMFKGTTNYSREQYETMLKNIGADGNAYTSDDLTNYHQVFPKEHLDTMLMLEADRFQNLIYEEAEFRTEALAVKGEYLKNNASPYGRMIETLRDTAYTTHTYKHTTMGFIEDIEDMPNQIDYAAKFFKRWYSPEYTSVIIVGDVDADDAVKMVEKHWGQWQPANYKMDIPTEPKQTAAKYKHQVYEGLPNSYMVMGFHGPAISDTEKDKAAIDILDSLFFGRTSDLYQNVVMQNRWAESVQTWFPNRKDPSQLMIFAETKEGENLDKVRQAIAETIAKARTELVSEKKLNELKSNIKYSFARGFDSSDSIASTLASYVHFQRDPEIINRLFRIINDITPEDVRKYANKYFIDSGRTTVTMADASSIPGFDQEINIAQIAEGMANKEVVTEFAMLDKRNGSALIDLNFLFNIGPAADPAGKKGLAALTAAMISGGGSESKSLKDIQSDLFPIAGSFGNQVDKEMTVFRGSIHKDNLAKYYDVISDQLLNPGWKEDDFKRIRDQLVSAVKNGLKASNDEELGKEMLYAEIYKGHPYGSFNSGAVSDLEKLTLEDVKAFYNQYYTQKNLTLGVTGNVSDEALATIKADLAQLPVGETRGIDIPDAPLLKGRKATIIEKDSQSVAVSFGFPFDLTRDHQDWVAMWLVRSWLGEHRSSNSHLYQRIRASRGMNYGDYAYIEYYPRGMYQTKPDANLGRKEQIFQIWIRPLRSNNDAHFATRVAMYEIEKLIKNGMKKEDFEVTKNFLMNFVPQMTDSQSRQLGYALDSEYYGIPDFVNYVRGGLKNLTVEQVNQAIKRHIQTENLQFVFISKDPKDLKARLTSEQASPLTYNSPKGEDIMQEDKVIQKYPLKLNKKAVKIVKLDEVFE
jgi:zinc protease